MANGGHYELGYEDIRFETVVSPSFYCPICLLVLREPVMCKNQHYFCTSCIKKHLAKSAFCPTCLEHLSVNTLNEAPRIVQDYLSELNIHCDYYARGCCEMVKLNQLKHHVATCGFGPVQCSNEGCTADLNFRDKLYHQAEVCDFRKLKCHECSQLKHEAVKMKREILARQDQIMRTMKAEISACQNEIKSEMKEGMKKMENVIMNEVLEIVNKAVQNITVEMKVTSARMKNELTEKIKDQFQSISFSLSTLIDQKQEERRKDVAKEPTVATKQSVARPWPGIAVIKAERQAMKKVEPLVGLKETREAVQPWGGLKETREA
ncbi:E3 ubiquitin- ligase PDZRN3, partial [Paramuricea clavata]